MKEQLSFIFLAEIRDDEFIREHGQPTEPNKVNLSDFEPGPVGLFLNSTQGNEVTKQLYSWIEGWM